MILFVHYSLQSTDLNCQTPKSQSSGQGPAFHESEIEYQRERSPRSTGRTSQNPCLCCMCVYACMRWFGRSSPLIFKGLEGYNTEAPHLKWSQHGSVDYKTYWQLHVDSCLERDWAEMEEGQGKNSAGWSFITSESSWGKNRKGPPRVEMEGASTTEEVLRRTRAR